VCLLNIDKLETCSKFIASPYARLSVIRTDLTHEYFSVDIELLWFTAKDILPKLKPQFKKVLGELR
jgi:uncharacterized protein with HEPN domain